MKSNRISLFPAETRPKTFPGAAARAAAGLVLAAALAGAAAAAGCASSSLRARAARPVEAAAPTLIPRPALLEPGEGRWSPGPAAAVAALPASEGAATDPALLAEAEALAAFLRSATGLPFPLAVGAPRAGAVVLRLAPARTDLGDEGYELSVRADGAEIAARTAAGVFYGGRTLRSLFPAAIESGGSLDARWDLPVLRIVDVPRFRWRGAMLDVARSFFTVEEVERYMEVLARYKMNRLHLHLSDDQGFRLDFASFPRLASVGGSGAVAGGRSGFYSRDDWKRLEASAAALHIVLVPEIDMPGHVNAIALAYPELNGAATPAAPYDGIEVGFSSLDLESPAVDAFVRDLFAELAAITSGPWIHVGGDEPGDCSDEAYAAFVSRAKDAVRAAGKIPVGWADVARGRVEPGDLVQHWNPRDWRSAPSGAAAGARVIMSPADRAYLDMKYDPSTRLGLDWAGCIDLRRAYSWDPADLMGGVGEDAVEGVEAPLWSETLRSTADLEFMAFPRALAIAELAWSPPGGDRKDFERRAEAALARLEAGGIGFGR